MLKLNKNTYNYEIDNYKINKYKNRPIYILPYNAKLNSIENLFSQIKNYY